jgi:glucosamine--fructose-6-phosphate aminotransferase (isomerizing)
LAIICADEPDQIIAARHGSPLCVGIGKGAMFVASEVCAFARHSLNYIALEDGEVAVVKIHDHSLDLSRTEMAVYEKIEMSPAPYAHWTIKEIMEQPESIARALGYGGRFKSDGSVKLGGMDDNAAMLRRWCECSRDFLFVFSALCARKSHERHATLHTTVGVNHLVMAACGTSYFAGLYGAKLMRMLGCFDTVQVFDAAEINRDVYSRDDRGLLVLSQSGETKDTHRAVVQAGERGIPKMSIVNQVGSLIARSTKCGVYLNAGREHAVASTKAFSSQVVACAMVAGWFSQNRTDAKARSQKRREVIDSLHRLPTYLGMSLRTHDAVKDLAKKLYQNKDMFILGKGFAEPIAYEGALKIKELTYIHAEGYSGGALKHGPFALLNDGLPVVLIILDDQHAELMRIAAQEVRARGAFTVVITDKPSLARNVCDEVIVIPSNGPLTALLASIPLQLLAYEMSVLKGINPDKPKNLAKAVTVD